jgi:hypothetical protein
MKYFFQNLVSAKMKTLITIALLATSLNVMSASQDAKKCEAKMISSAEKMIDASEEITDIQPMDENNFVVTYYMYGTCYNSIFVEIAPDSDCEIVSVQEDYEPRCH